MAISAVCFDAGGVLVRISYRWGDVATRLGIPLPPGVNDDALLTDCDFFNQYQAGELAEDGYLAALANYLNANVDVAARVHNGILVEPYPMVDQLVLDLKQAGILTGCLSNTNAPHWLTMLTSGRFPANEAMDLGVASHLVGMQKPAPEIFREFERLSGRKSDEIAFFDDTKENVEGAMACGWHANLVDPNGDTAEQMRNALQELQVLGRPAFRNKV